MTRDELRALVAARYAHSHALVRRAKEMKPMLRERAKRLAWEFQAACEVALDITNDASVSDHEAEGRVKALFLNVNTSFAMAHKESRGRIDFNLSPEKS